jgi:methylase of polypeptide subunit release factors
MIQAVNEYTQLLISQSDSKNNIILDIWTWCGVLCLSVLLHNPTAYSKAYLSEYIDDTLSLAVENYEILKPRLWEAQVFPVKSNLLQFIKDSDLVSQKEFTDSNLVLVANLPYIPEDTFNQNVWDNVKNREPKPAFVWWDDGLIYYREMFQQIFDYKIKPIMFLEMMTWQVDILRQEFWEQIIFEEVKTFHFNIRIVKAYLK